MFPLRNGSPKETAHVPWPGLHAEEIAEDLEAAVEQTGPIAEGLGE
jgi:hypothetical protein